MTNTRRASSAALRVAAAAGLLTAGKVVIGLTTGSVAVLSSALDSAGDMLASFANFVFLTIAAKPPDADHHFGHGKAEHLATLLQGAVLMTGAITIGWRAITRIRHPEPVDASAAAIVTMVVSIVLTIGIATYLRRSAAASGSAALAGDALHYTTDYIANGVTIAALVIVRITGNPLFDSILGISVAAWIAWSSLYLVWRAGGDLMDPALPAAEVDRIVAAIDGADHAVIGHRELRTRRSAGLRFIEFELCIDRDVSFERAHEITETVKARIREHFPDAMVTVHAEPVERARTAPVER